jgi:ABC-type dipeptide/oligopeptide/nickel transport system ATPase component
MQSIPVADPIRRWDEELKVAPEAVADMALAASRDRCLYAERCSHVMDVCWRVHPPLAARDGRQVACHVFG